MNNPIITASGAIPAYACVKVSTSGSERVEVASSAADVVFGVTLAGNTESGGAVDFQTTDSQLDIFTLKAAGSITPGQYVIPTTNGTVLASTNGPFVSLDTASIGQTFTARKFNAGAIANFTPSGSATSRTIDSKLNDTLSVKDFGATGDGSTDDKAAIQLALNEGGTSNRSVYFPGTSASYKISGVLTIPNGVVVFGDGFNSLIETTNSGANMFNMGHDTTVKELHFKVPAASESGDPDTQTVIFASLKNNVIIQNNRIQITAGNGGVLVRNCKNVLIKDNLIFGGVFQGGDLSGAGFADIVVISNEAVPPAASEERNRVIISGNYCFSNNGNGIIGNYYGNTSETLITNNICVTLDPATCTVGGTWKEIISDGSATGTLRRRHGIAFGYGEDVNKAPRSIISNNLCRNTLRTGIYVQAGGSDITPAPVLVMGNMCSLNGQDAGAGSSLEGGIWFNNTNPNSVITGNVVYDFKKVGQGAINYIFSAGSQVSGPTISNNYVFDSAGSGIQLVGKIRYMTIKDNQIVNSAGNDIQILCNADFSNIGGFLIEGNTIKRNNFNFASILLDQQDGTIPSTVKGNRIVGHDKTTGGLPIIEANAATLIKNTAFTSTRPLLSRVIENIVDNFHVGFAICGAGYMPTVTRNFQVDLSRNTIRNCNFGFGIGAQNVYSSAPVCDNIFETGVTPISSLMENGGGNGYTAGHIARKDGNKFVVLDLNAVPDPANGSSGFWAVGDRIEFTAPTAGGFIGATCTTAGGSTMVWKNYGAVSA